MRKLLSSLVSVAVGNMGSKYFLILLAIASILLPANKLKASGSIVAWGNHWDVPSPNIGFVAIAAGHYNGLGLKSDGSVVAWGSNDDGECNVPLPNTGFVAVAAGTGYSMGLKADGSIVAWGYNYYGQCDVPEQSFCGVFGEFAGIEGVGF